MNNQNKQEQMNEIAGEAIMAGPINMFSLPPVGASASLAKPCAGLGA